MKKKIVIYIPDSTAGVYLPLLWASCKSYYELNGLRPDDYEWIHPRINYQFNNTKLKEQLLEIKPDVFGISMYIWNDVQCLEMAKWIKEQFPKCLIVSGGPQQYFKHESDWFQKYPFLDASLDGGEYGELTVADILNNLRDDNTVDWNTVREVVYPSKNRKTILKSKHTTPKRDFAWDYSAYAMQREVMLEVAEEIRALVRIDEEPINNIVQGKLETTRGCPYSCAFCDWGGGIGSKVIMKSPEMVKKDIDVLEEAAVGYVFICDANFGILGERDVNIIEYMAERKQRNPKFFHLYFGGFVKSDKHTDILQRILDLDAQNNLTWDLSYKASVQSIHQDVLKNIRRTDISFEKHIELSKHLKRNYNFSTYAECISGLPGITPDKWYHEMNVFASHDMDICLYNWHLLPETPSYGADFRKRMGMVTVNKYNNMQPSNSTLRKSEVVVETFSYTKDDYKEMWIAFSLQRGFWATGLIDNTLNKIFKTSSIGYGDFIKKFYREFLRGNTAGPILHEMLDKIDTRYAQYYDPDSDVSNTAIDFPELSSPMSGVFMFTIFYSFEGWRDNFKQWLLTEFPYLTDREVTKDLNLVITITNRNAKRFDKTRLVIYSNTVLDQFKHETVGTLTNFMMTQMETFTKTKFLTAKAIGI
jgi:hypothetical protein